MQRKWGLVLMVTLMTALLAGCGSRAELHRLQSENAQLRDGVRVFQGQAEGAQGQVKTLQDRVAALEAAKGGKPVSLIDPHYPPAVGGTPGWEYYKTVEGDIDGDGAREKVAVTTNAGWHKGGWAWDDGHPWHVYVEESDGARTYLFSRLVQLGSLRVMLGSQEFDKGPMDVVIEYISGNGSSIYRVKYTEPGKFEAEQVLEVPNTRFAQYVDPKYHD